MAQKPAIEKKGGKKDEDDDEMVRCVSGCGYAVCFCR
jgi:hypothetical protein